MGGCCFNSKQKSVEETIITQKKVTQQFEQIIFKDIDIGVSTTAKIQNIKFKKTLRYMVKNEESELKGLKLVNYLINSEDKDCLINALTQLSFMRDFNKAQLSEIMKLTKVYCLKEEQVLFKKGSIGNCFFVVKSGILQVTDSDLEKNNKKIGKGEFFGEVALLQQDTRKISITALKETYLFCLKRKSFRKIVKSLNETLYEENKLMVDSILFLSKSIFKKSY